MPAKNSNASFGQELVIDVAEFSDSGRYQCTAVNAASGRPSAVVDFTLTVECMYCELNSVNQSIRTYLWSAVRRVRIIYARTVATRLMGRVHTDDTDKTRQDKTVLSCPYRRYKLDLSGLISYGSVVSRTLQLHCNVRLLS